jgi:DNA-binding MarR family transcriptional regulator
MMELTRRQEEFIRKMIDLYLELHGPFHYSQVAERLGISPFTAYDMLRLFEKKGLVTSQYHLADDKAGPGRSEIFFLPTAEAHRVFLRLTEDANPQDWDALIEAVLSKVRSGALQDRELVNDVLARVPPEGQGALRYCVEVMTVITLLLRRGDGRRLLLSCLPTILPSIESANPVNLSLLGGFALGILANENIDDRDWGRELIEHVSQYQTLVVNMNPRLCRKLAASLREVFKPLEEVLPG